MRTEWSQHSTDLMTCIWQCILAKGLVWIHLILHWCQIQSWKKQLHRQQLVIAALLHYKLLWRSSRRKVIAPFVLTEIFGSYDIFTYLPEQESFSFISVHALEWISKIRLCPFEVLLPGDTLLGCCTELIWYTGFYVNCGNPLYASYLVCSVGRGYKDLIVLFLKAPTAWLPIVMMYYRGSLLY